MWSLETPPQETGGSLARVTGSRLKRVVNESDPYVPLYNLSKVLHSFLDRKNNLFMRGLPFLGFPEQKNSFFLRRV